MDSQREEKRPRMYHKFTKKFIDNLNFSVGDSIKVDIAHKWQRGYGWSCYSESEYKVESINHYNIVGRNTKYPSEQILISRPDIDSCRFIIKTNY